MNISNAVDGSQLVRQAFIKYFQINDVPPESREEVLTKLITLIDQGMVIRIFDEMSDHDADELEALIDAGTIEGLAIHEVIRSKLPNLQVMLAEEMILVKTSLACCLKTRGYTNDTPTQEALDAATDFSGDIGGTLAGHGILFNIAALGIGLAFDPAHHRRTPLAKEQWRMKKVSSCLGNVAGGVWFDVILLVILVHLQKIGKIAIFPKWALVWTPDWFARRGLATQLLLTLTIPAATACIMLAMLVVFRLRARKLLKSMD